LDIEVTAKLAAIGFGAITAGNAIIAIIKGRTSQLRDDYKFAKEFIADLNGVAAESAFLKQRGSHALTGDASIEFRTLEYLWRLEDPSQRIRDYSLGFQYLEHLHTASAADPIRFVRPYDQHWRRWLFKGWFLLCYVVTYLLSTSPLLLSILGKWGKSSPYPALVVMCIVFLPMAFLAMKARVRMQRAEKLVECQRTRLNNSAKPTPLRGAA
jgi:hypothetical protein